MIRIGPMMVALLAAWLVAEPAHGQNPTEVRVVVDALFDSMRSGDGVAAARLFHPDALLYSIAEQDGQPILRIDPVSDFLEAVGGPRTQVWDERISDVEIRVDGPLATAWMNYRFYIGDAFSHCGVNAIQLFQGASGWQIIHLSDTRRLDGCSDPQVVRGATDKPGAGIFPGHGNVE